MQFKPNYSYPPGQLSTNHLTLLYTRTNTLQLPPQRLLQTSLRINALNVNNDLYNNNTSILSPSLPPNNRRPNDSNPSSKQPSLRKDITQTLPLDKLRSRPHRVEARNNFHPNLNSTRLLRSMELPLSIPRTRSAPPHPPLYFPQYYKFARSSR